jgi:hypothetical protein
MFTCLCLGCGCSDLRGCPLGCWWVRLAVRFRVGLCSQCVSSLARKRSRRVVRLARRAAGRVTPCPR